MMLCDGEKEAFQTDAAGLTGVRQTAAAQSAGVKW